MRVVTRALRDPVTFRFDGEQVSAERGEPIAAALVASGRIAIARSPKFHRPRGPSCFRAACDGCLARVDGVPNVMTCLHPAREGAVVVAQNTLGSRDTDLLRVTDWFFPKGMNHHELFAGVPGVQQLMQTFARRVAGLGKIPDAPGESHAAKRRSVDAFVVGAGPSGMLAAMALADRGRDVEVACDALEPGGSALAAFDPAFDALIAKYAEYTQKNAKTPIKSRMRTTVAGIYGDDIFVVSEAGAEIVNAKTLVLATGAHDGVLAFEGNDVPGVMSARAGAWLLRRGVSLGKKIVVAISEGGGPFGEAFARESKSEVTVMRAEPTRAVGSSRVKRVAFGKKEIAASALLVDAPRAPAYELAEQAGATLAHEPRGYVVRAEHGMIRDGVHAVGELTGTPLDLGAMRTQIDATFNRR
jgi:sarcosine oxidase subunit alpha